MIVLVTGGLMCALALAGALRLARECGCVAPKFNGGSVLHVAELLAAFAIGMLLLLRGRIDRRLGRQVAGVLLAIGGAFGTQWLVVMVDESAGDLLHLLDRHGVLALPVLAAPVLVGCGALLIFSRPARAPCRSRRCRSCGPGA
jgi:peptidoglycan/LPS O-acetylase OafA/YrhL